MRVKACNEHLNLPRLALIRGKRQIEKIFTEVLVTGTDYHSFVITEVLIVDYVVNVNNRDFKISFRKYKFCK